MSNWYQSTTQGGALIVGTSTAVLANSNLDVTGITLTNATSSAITVGKMTVTWTNAARKISQILINGTTVWSSVGPGTPTSTQLSGVLLDIQDIVLAAATTTPLTRLRFDGAMTGNTFTITFTMGDATTKVANSIVL
jgi:phage tail sheath gpL-like